MTPYRSHYIIVYCLRGLISGVDKLRQTIYLIKRITQIGTGEVYSM